MGRSDTDRPVGTARWWVLVAALAVAVLVAALLYGGGSPQPSPAGIPEPGPLTGWGLPTSKLLGYVFALGALACLLRAILPASRLDTRIVAEERAPLRRAGLLLIGWWITVVATTFFSASDQFALPISELPADVVNALVRETDVGRALAVQGTLVLIALGSLWWGLRVRHLLVTLALVLLAATPPVITGHAAQSGNHDLAIVSLLVHVIALSLWVGGVAALAWVARDEPAQVERAAWRVGMIATVAVVATAITGTLSAAVRLGSLNALLTTEYGVLVLAKSVVMVAIVAAGIVVRRASLPTSRPSRAALRELMLMALALGIGVALGRTPTPVGDQYPTLRESLLGGPLPPAPDFLNLVWGFRASGVGLLVLGVGSVLYLLGLRTLRRRGDAWPVHRTIAWFAGLAVIGYATLGGLGVYSHVLFSAHMAAHMLISMVAPAFMVLGAPVTLALRTLPGSRDGAEGPRAILIRLLSSRVLRILTHPVVAAAIFISSLYGIYLTDAYDSLMQNHLGHAFMELHFLISGLLFFDALIGVDPLPNRLPHLARLGVMLVALPFHAFFSVTLMAADRIVGGEYYRLLDRPYATDLADDQYLGGGISWALGEVPMVIVAAVLLGQWFVSDRRAAKRFDRREDQAGDDGALAAYNEALGKLRQR